MRGQEGVSCSLEGDLDGFGDRLPYRLILGGDGALQLSERLKIASEGIGCHCASLCEGVALRDAAAKGWEGHDVAPFFGRLEDRRVRVLLGSDCFSVGFEPAEEGR